MQHTKNRWMLGVLWLAGVSGTVAPQVQAQTVPDQHRVVPGERIGRVFLGDSQRAVRRRLGAPSATVRLPGGLTSEVWRSKTYNRFTERGHTLEVIYRRGVVTQIEATNPVFKTASGYSTDSTIEEWLAAFRTRPTKSHYVYSGDKYDQTYYDWIGSGLTLETHAEGNPFDKHTDVPHTVIVHRKRVRVVPDAGGTRVPAGTTRKSMH